MEVLQFLQVNGGSGNVEDENYSNLDQDFAVFSKEQRKKPRVCSVHFKPRNNLLCFKLVLRLIKQGILQNDIVIKYIT